MANMNVTFSCQIYNKTFPNIDELGCGILQTAAVLFYCDFGYICMGPVGLIILISIFGRIKGHYRWFILNQALWDLVTSNHYSCSNIMTTWVKKSPSCFYFIKTYGTYNDWWNLNVDLFINRVILFNSYSALLLLSTSRFMALYFPHAYSKLIKGRRILFTIIIFNFIIILFDSNQLFAFFHQKRANEIVDECIINQNLTKTICETTISNFNKDSMYNFYKTLNLGSGLLQHFKPILFLFLSVIATILIIWKMAKQIIFQLKQERKDFGNNVRISAVIGFQVLINCFGVFLEAFYQFIASLLSTFQLKILTSKSVINGRDVSDYLDLRVPFWIGGTYGLSSDYCRPMIIQFRILIEAFVILIIMTGYREAIAAFIKYIFNGILPAMKRIKNIKLISKKSKVSNPSLF